MTRWLMSMASAMSTVQGRRLREHFFKFAPGGPHQQFEEIEKGAALNEALLKKYNAFSKMIFTDFDSDDED